MIVCYAPTNEAEYLAKEKFWVSGEQLGIRFQTLEESLPRR